MSMDLKLSSILNEVNEEILKYNGENLLAAGVINSLEIFQILAQIEEQYSIEIDVKDVLPINFETVDAIENLIKKYVILERK